MTARCTLTTAVLDQITQTDPAPLGAGSAFESTYTYAGNNPSGYLDPSGLRKDGPSKKCGVLARLCRLGDAVIGGAQQHGTGTVDLVWSTGVSVYRAPTALRGSVAKFGVATCAQVPGSGAFEGIKGSTYDAAWHFGTDVGSGNVDAAVRQAVPIYILVRAPEVSRWCRKSTHSRFDSEREPIRFGDQLYQLCCVAPLRGVELWWLTR